MDMTPTVDELERILVLCAKYQIDVLHLGDLKVVRRQQQHAPVYVPAPAPASKDDIEELLSWSESGDGVTQ